MRKRADPLTHQRRPILGAEADWIAPKPLPAKAAQWLQYAYGPRNADSVRERLEWIAGDLAWFKATASRTTTPEQKEAAYVGFVSLASQLADAHRNGGDASRVAKALDSWRRATHADIDSRIYSALMSSPRCDELDAALASPRRLALPDLEEALPHLSAYQEKVVSRQTTLPRKIKPSRIHTPTVERLVHLFRTVHGDDFQPKVCEQWNSTRSPLRPTPGAKNVHAEFLAALHFIFQSISFQGSPNAWVRAYLTEKKKKQVPRVKATKARRKA